MSQIIALLDANVLYSAQLRDILLQLAIDNLYQARWTETIQDEWINALLTYSPSIDRNSLLRTRKIMNSSIRDALVLGFEHLIDDLYLPDPDDRHVLAAAIWGHCNVIVTYNLKHFPAKALESHAMQVQTPDEFLVRQLLTSPALFCLSVRRILERLNQPSYSVASYVANLNRAGLKATAMELQQYVHLLQ